MKQPTPPPTAAPRRPRKLRVTERQALQVVREVAWAFGADPYGSENTSITVRRDVDRAGDCVIEWDRVPDWSAYIPAGGDHEGLGLCQVPAIRVPKGVRVETRSHYSIALYREA